jgi:hypothetical protein
MFARVRLPSSSLPCLRRLHACVRSRRGQVPLALGALSLRHFFDGFGALSQRFARHYRNQMISNSVKVLGGFEALGSPLQFLEQLKDGARDFVYEPVNGLSKVNVVRSCGHREVALLAAR